MFSHSSNETADQVGHVSQIHLLQDDEEDCFWRLTWLKTQKKERAYQFFFFILAKDET
jgi:hypothetical protein